VKTLLITASTRPVRVGDQITEVVARILGAHGAQTEIVDLRSLDLPFLDEPLMPAMGQYAHEHTRRWSQTVADADAVVIVTPQYNAGYPAALKNAVDFLFAEWRDKPGAIVSYGGHGGGQSYDQLHQVLSFIGMRMDPTGVQVVLPRDAYGEDWRLVDAEQVVAPYVDELDSLAARLVASVGRDPEAGADEPASQGLPPQAQDVVDRLLAALEARDADALGELFTDDGTLLDAAGDRLRGREEITARFDDAALPGADARAGLDETGRESRLLSSTVAHVEVTWTLTGDPAVPRGRGMTTVQVVRDANARAWRIAACAHQGWGLGPAGSAEPVAAGALAV
jgi:uncharacterized protein (TIGR02246 family)